MPVRTLGLTAGVVSRLTLAPGEWNHVGVMNLSDVNTVYVTLNGVDPVPGADDVWAVPAGCWRELHFRGTTGNDIRCLCSAATTVEVELT
jgi:hypothetical protein